MGGLIKTFTKGTSTIGTWFGIDKNKNKTNAAQQSVGLSAGPSKSGLQRRAQAQQSVGLSAGPSKSGLQRRAQAQADAAAAAELDATNAGVAGTRQRRRQNALSTGAADPGTAQLSSTLAYGQPTLGG